jgi:phosphoribosyl-dephospho-CoA transferase
MKQRLEAVLLANGAGVRVPGVVRREDADARPGCVPVGFSDPFAGNGERLRVAGFARLEDILSAATPYELASLPLSARSSVMQALAQAKEKAAPLSIRLGVWGSAAIETYTGLPCTREGSDLDLLVNEAPIEALSAFMDEMRGVEDSFHLRIDVELDLACGYGVQLRELLGAGRTVLGKGLSDVVLLDRTRIIAELPHNGHCEAGPSC